MATRKRANQNGMAPLPDLPKRQSKPPDTGRTKSKYGNVKYRIRKAGRRNATRISRPRRGGVMGVRG